ncbi:putative prolyl 4-hydroxylase alpha subunit [Xylogone sp. PMI_703]|nr:putative prolyl 4-hydroxylase alpha subunit [Xylogone sp. PMI_703]
MPSTSVWSLQWLVVLLFATTALAFSPVDYLQKQLNGLTNSDDIGVDKKTGCPKHHYNYHLLSEDPLVVYIDSFISKEEAAHLADLSEGQFKDSVLWSDDGRVVDVDPNYRSSQTASLARDQVIRCIEERARAFPYYSSKEGLIKPLVVQRYGISNQYKDHYDWFPDGPYIDGNIESTFFVYIQANCTGGGTNFPRLDAPREEKWCEFVDCNQPWDAGVTFLPLVGNAIFWKNLEPSGSGNVKTLHAGLPVTSGMKTGLNIWTWEKNTKKAAV